MKSFYVFHHGVQPGGARMYYAFAFGTFAEVKLIADQLLWQDWPHVWQEIHFQAYLDGEKKLDVDLLPFLTGHGPDGVTFGLVDSPSGFKVTRADPEVVETEEFLAETTYRIDWSRVPVPPLPEPRLERGEKVTAEAVYASEEELEWGVNDLEHDEMFGGVFLSVILPTIAVEPEWLTSAVVGVARGIEANGDCSGLPVLADALEEAGCDNEFFLRHAREPFEVHAHGSWLPKLLIRAAEGKGPWLT